MTSNRSERESNDQAPQPVLPLPTAIGRPAQRTLANAGYTHLGQLTTGSEAEIKRLHGVGPKALNILRQTLAAHGLAFADQPLPRDEHIGP